MLASELNPRKMNTCAKTEKIGIGITHTHTLASTITVITVMRTIVIRQGRDYP